MCLGLVFFLLFCGVSSMALSVFLILKGLHVFNFYPYDFSGFQRKANSIKFSSSAADEGGMDRKILKESLFFQF